MFWFGDVGDSWGACREVRDMYIRVGKGSTLVLFVLPATVRRLSGGGGDVAVSPRYFAAKWEPFAIPTFRLLCLSRR